MRKSIVTEKAPKPLGPFSQAIVEGDFIFLAGQVCSNPVTGKLEPGLRNASKEKRYQFERLGYFCVDKDSTAEKVVFNRTVGLRDTWAKIEKRQTGTAKIEK